MQTSNGKSNENDQTANDQEDKTLPYAFFSHESACEVLRKVGVAGRRWPEERRMLPIWGDCVTGQRQMSILEKHVNLEALGIKTWPADVLSPTKFRRSRGGRARVHVWSSVLPAESMVQVHLHVFASGPEFTLFQLSHVHNMHWPQYEAVVDKHIEESKMLARYGYEGEAKLEPPLLWQPVRSLVSVVRRAMEFLGTYRLGASDDDAIFDQPPLMTLDSGRKFVQSVTKRRASKVMLRALELAIPNSGSPRETDLVLMLTLPVDSGGYGLPRPVLNKLQNGPAKWYEISGDSHIMPDLLWEAESLVVEYYGHKSHRDMGRQKTDHDIMRANTLREMGFTVLEVTHGVVGTFVRMDYFARQVAKLLHVSLVEPGEEDLILRHHLYDELFAVRWDVS